MRVDWFAKAQHSILLPFLVFSVFLHGCPTIAQQYSCQSCNVVSFPPISRSSSDLNLTSICTPLSCDSSSSTCVTSFGETIVCNNTFTFIPRQGPLLCNCGAPVTISSASLSALNRTATIDPTAFANYRPRTCTATPPSISPSDAMSACDVSKTVQVCSFYQSGFPRSECLPLPYDPANPEAPYSENGFRLTCDGTLQTDSTGREYVCKCGGNLDPNVINPLYKPDLPGDLPHPFIYDCTVQRSRNVLVDVHTALGLVQNSEIDLRPIVDLVPT